MKSKFVKNIVRLGLFLLGVLAILFIITLFWGENEIGHISIKDGQGIFENEDVQIKTEVHSTATGNLRIVENTAKHSVDFLETNYISPKSYKIVGPIKLFDGTMTVRFPIPEKLKGKSSADLKKGLRILTEQPGLAKNGDKVPIPNIHKVVLDEKTQTISATIDHVGEDGALGSLKPLEKVNFFKKSMSFANPPDNAEEDAEMDVYAIYVEKYETIISKHFRMHYVENEMLTERLKEFMRDLERIVKKVEKIGLNTDELNMKIDVYLKKWPSSTNIQYGEMASNNFFRSEGVLNFNKDILLQKDLSAEDLEEMRMTAAHELLHLVQQNYWRKQHWQRFSYKEFIWPDEACAIAFESYVAKENDYAAGPMKTNIGMLVKNPILNFNDAKKSHNDAQDFGYAMGYIVQYLMEIHPRKEAVLGDIYNYLSSDAVNSPKMAFNKILDDVGGTEKFWLEFIHTSMTNPKAIHQSKSVKLDLFQNRFLGKGSGTGEDTHIKFAKDKYLNSPKIVKSNAKNQMVFETELPNLSTDVVIMQLDNKDPIIQSFLEGLGRKYTISVSGDEKVGAMIYNYDKNATPKVNSVTTLPNNLLKPGQQTTLNNINYVYLMLVNHDDNIDEYKKRKITVTVTFQPGENFAEIAPPPAQDIIDQKVLDELNRWKNHCNKQKQAQQQSNQMLMNYYSNKEEELKTAISLLKEGTDFYGQLGFSIQPEDPKSLVKNLTSSISKIENIQDYAFNAKIKMEEAAEDASADQHSYQLSAQLFDSRQVAYWELLKYLKAVEDAENTVVSPPPSVPPTKPDISNDKDFHQGTWTFMDDFTKQAKGSISISANTLSVNIGDLQVSGIPYTVEFSDATYGWDDSKKARIITTINYDLFPPNSVYKYYRSSGSDSAFSGTIELFNPPLKGKMTYMSCKGLNSNPADAPRQVGSGELIKQ